MIDNYELGLKEGMACILNLGNNCIEIKGEEVPNSFISLSGTSAINITTDFIEIEDENKIYLNIKPELEAEGGKNYQLHIPAGWKHNIQVETAKGSVAVKDITGQLQITTNVGNVALKDILGSVNVRCTKGSIDGFRVIGSVDLSTSNGEISIKESALEGGTVKTGNGKLSMQIKPSELGNLNLYSGDGHIRLALPEDGDFLIKAQTKGSLENHMTGCAAHSENETSVIMKGEGRFAIMVVNFKGGISFMNYEDFDRDWSRQENFGFDGFKIPDAGKILGDLFNQDISKTVPDFLKNVSDFSEGFGKFGEEVSRQVDDIKRTVTGGDQEIILILKMLKEDKISIEEAERLISALRKK